jgi:methylmalonyl-CoA/ethylmalonyl-CoA epimerase
LIAEELFMTRDLDHIAVATTSLEKGLSFYRDLLGLEHCGTEEVKEQKVRAAVLEAGDTHIELLEPTSEESPVARFIRKRGEGLHHLAFKVHDIEAAVDRVVKAGGRMIDREPRSGVGGTRIAFIHPTTPSGVLVELVEHPRK